MPKFSRKMFLGLKIANRFLRGNAFLTELAPKYSILYSVQQCLRQKLRPIAYFLIKFDPLKADIHAFDTIRKGYSKHLKMRTVNKPPTSV
jgi:predicted nucleotidyltransferase